MKREYNLLTQRLLAEGYTVNNYPNYVQICTSRFPGNDPLYNVSGGFEYKRYYSDKFVYKTGCGKYVLGKNVIDNMGYKGIEWCHENDNPVVRCPFDNSKCGVNDSRLCKDEEEGGGLCFQQWCVCHRVNENEPYNYENSIEKADEERHLEMERKYEEYSKVHNGKVCRNHMRYDEHTRSWKQVYEPSRCAKQCLSINGYCPILDKQLSKKRGNVYYDLKTSGIRQQRGEQLTLFDGERWTEIRKGIRVFEKPCSMDICEAFVKVQKDKIERDYCINHSWERMIDKTITWEFINIRAESRPSRDLIADLEDIRAGIKISFDDDLIKHEKENKREKRKISQQNKVKKLENKLIKIGYSNMELFSLDRIHADKWLSPERINELEKIRQQRLKEEQDNPVQLSIFDMM